MFVGSSIRRLPKFNERLSLRRHGERKAGSVPGMGIEEHMNGRVLA